METPSKFGGKGGRRNLLAAFGSLALFSFLVGRFRVKSRMSQPSAPKEGQMDCGPGSPNIVKMLTEDGRLVEVDLRMGRTVKKVTNDELRDWIKPDKL
jgi:hypothetical protein